MGDVRPRFETWLKKSRQFNSSTGSNTFHSWGVGTMPDMVNIIGDC
jgi:hypothetical protein